MAGTIGKLLAAPFRLVAGVLRLFLALVKHTFNLLGGVLRGLMKALPLGLKLLRSVLVGTWRGLYITLRLTVKLLHSLAAVVLFPLRVVFGSD